MLYQCHQYFSFEYATALSTTDFNIKKLYILPTTIRVCGGAVRWGTALQAGRSRVLFPMMPFEFFIDIILPVDSAANKNEYQEFFLEGVGGGGAVCRTDNLTTFLCRMFWSLGAPTSWNPHGQSNYSFYMGLRTNRHNIPVLLVGEATVSHCEMEIWFLDSIVFLPNTCCLFLSACLPIYIHETTRDQLKEFTRELTL